jgi:hypothetical protein
VISPETVQKVLELIKRRADYEYFFSQLSSPDWIMPLKEAGMFNAPPEPVREGQYITFSNWPESEYLARMAERAPEIVAEVALQIPDTENTRVNDDLNKIALSIPAPLAVRFVPKAKRWATSSYTPIFPEKLGQLIAHLARGGYGNDAIDIARVVLAVLPDPREAESGKEDNEFRFPPHPRARFELWDYSLILKKHVPSLVDATQERALELLCSLLTDAIRLSRNRGDDLKPHDHSYIWRRGVEHPPEVDDIPNALVSAVRDASEQIARADVAKVPAIIGILTKEEWLVFHRIALHLLRTFPDAVPELVARWLTSESNFGVLELWHEYFLLAGEQFAHLKPDEQKVILDWIDAGPDLEKYKESQERWSGERPSDEIAEKYAKYWKLKRLASFRDALPTEWKKKYTQWEAEVGPPEHPDYVNPPSTVRWGLESPKSDEDLSSMSFEQIISFLKDWQPSSDNPLGPSYEGLAQKITSLIKTNPEIYASEAGQFEGLEPTYVRALISGLREAVAEKKVFQWLAVINLCDWVVSKPFEEREAESSFREQDPDWMWTRGAIAHLLSDALKREASEAQIPFELRSSVWKVIERLTEDPNPSPEHETRYGGTNMEPMTLSLNTNRGEAMHCVVHYALWCRQHLDAVQQDSTESKTTGFDEMPEVRAVLEKHLDPENDPSLAIRAVYGVWMPWLIELDKEWVTNNLFRIFPPQDDLRPLRDAAWETYIIFNRPWDNTFHVLRDEYARAIELIGKSSIERRHGEEPDRHLAEHLIVLFGRGRLGLNTEGSLLDRFFKTAPDDFREHALSFIGRSLINAEVVIPSEVVERFQSLWSARLQEAQSASSLFSYTGELAAFGWWFASAKFDDTWAIDQLRTVLKLSIPVDPYHMVLERLEQITPSMPIVAVECLGLMIENDKKGEYRYSWHESITAILEAAINSPEARQSAEALIHKLGARGSAYNYLRKLLPGGSGRQNS